MKIGIRVVWLPLLLLTIVNGCKKKVELKYDEDDFYNAVYDENLVTMQACLDHGVTSINTELINASDRQDRYTAFVFLLDNGADPNFTTGREYSRGADLLIGRNVDFALANTAFDPVKTRLLIDYGADVNKCVEPHANLLMHYIQSMYISRRRGYYAEIKDKALRSIRLLLEHGADISFRERHEITPLLIALNYNLKEAVALLLEFGVVPSAEPVQIDFNFDPLGFREWDENYGIVWQTDFLMLANCGYEDILMPYIQKGVITPDHADPDGHDIYYHTAEGGNPSLMMSLLPYAKDINSKRYDNGRYTGLTLLHIAAMNGNSETVKVLLGNGIDEEAKAKDNGGFEYTAFNLIGGNGDAFKRSEVMKVFSDFNPNDIYSRDYSEYRIKK